ncbi:MAG: peptidoglycan-binding protein, partial [Chloroflexota bacterium]
MAQPERGYIETIEGRYKRINFLFNPTEYSISKQNQWSVSGAKRGRDVATLEFGGGQPKQITLQLFFDAYEQEGGDVREYTDGLLKLMQIDQTLKSSNPNSGKGQPPKCRLQWGRVWSFNCVIENMTQKFTLFRDDGRPVRATVDLTLRQAEDENELPGQNPTTEGI